MKSHNCNIFMITRGQSLFYRDNTDLPKFSRHDKFLSLFEEIRHRHFEKESTDPLLLWHLLTDFKSLPRATASPCTPECWSFYARRRSVSFRVKT